MISIIILVISFLLDGIVSNFLPYMVGNLSFFTPLFTVMSLFLIYPLFKKKERKKYFGCLLITGILYDLCYTNLLFFHGIIFMFLGFVIEFLYKYLDVNFIMIIIEAFFLIVIYDAISAGLFSILQVVPISLDDFIYLLLHTLLANMIFLELGFFILKFIPKKYKNLSIN